MMGSRRRRGFFVIVLHLVGVSYYPKGGIVAVLPWPVALEPVYLQQQPQETIERHPIWLQDTSDGSCLGPTGTFTDCGDATLWMVEQQQQGDKWAFSVLDRDHESPESRRERRRRRRHMECLNRGGGDITKGAFSSLQVGLCRTRARRGLRFWRRPTTAAKSVWELDEDGNLQQPGGERCLHRGPENQAVLANCRDTNDNSETSAVHFSFLRYKTVSALDSKQRKQDASWLRAKVSTGKSSSTPQVKRIEPAMFPEMKDYSNLLFPRKPAEARNSKHLSPFHVRLLSLSNPILLADKKVAQLSKNFNIGASPSATLTSAGTPEINSMTSKIRRMQTHPYINTAKNEIWTCPQTQLEYHTDLNNYLGWSKEAGRQTLTGVGIYRKGYVIKVYGIAFYVSKRDVLADPALQPYATLTADQLRNRVDFYHLLRTMDENNKNNYFDRTILLKTNMQLSAETMRSSLQADWSYLTEEAKELLASTGMQNLTADAEMLQRIQSPDNPSRCSCSQTAPSSYQADPACCARGTELGFTWTKENVLEVRLNGRLMAVFERPDIAQGIFYEYLRYDDPISPEFRDRVVDGFPFLLGPLTRGLTTHTSATHKPVPGNGVLHAVAAFLDTCRYQTTEMAGHAGRSFREAVDHTGNAARTAGETVIEMGRELERRRALLVKHSVVASQTIGKVLSRDEETLESLSRWMAGESPASVVEEQPEDSPNPPLPRLIAYYAPDEIGPLEQSNINRFILALVHFYLLLLFIVSFPGSQYRIVIKRSSARSRIGFDDDCGDSSDEENNLPLSLPKSPNSQERLQCQQYLRRDTGDPLQQKSLSYFL